MGRGARHLEVAQEPLDLGDIDGLGEMIRAARLHASVSGFFQGVRGQGQDRCWGCSTIFFEHANGASGRVAGVAALADFPEQLRGVAAAFAGAFRVVRHSFRQHRYAGVPMETRGGLAGYDPSSRELVYYASHKAPRCSKQT